MILAILESVFIEAKLVNSSKVDELTEYLHSTNALGLLLAAVMIISM